MTDAELDQFAALLKAPDQDAYRWILGEPAPAEYETDLLEAVRRYRAAMGAKPA